VSATTWVTIAGPRRKSGTRRLEGDSFGTNEANRKSCLHARGPNRDSYNRVVERCRRAARDACRIGVCAFYRFVVGVKLEDKLTNGNVGGPGALLAIKFGYY
jgi:hypothetical protein